jgi:preprotein translocase subunit SecE
MILPVRSIARRSCAGVLGSTGKTTHYKKSKTKLLLETAIANWQRCCRFDAVGYFSVSCGDDLAKVGGRAWECFEGEVDEVVPATHIDDCRCAPLAFAGVRVLSPKRARQAGFAMDRALSGLVRIHEMAKVSPFKFLQEVRQETAKVTWPTRRETAITTLMVFVMAALAGVFFLFADQVIRFLVTLVLGIGS